MFDRNTDRNEIESDWFRLARLQGSQCYYFDSKTNQIFEHMNVSIRQLCAQKVSKDNIQMDDNAAAVNAS